MTAWQLLAWSLRLDAEILFAVGGLPLRARLALIALKYLGFLKVRLLRRGPFSSMVFGSRFCYNEPFAPASLQRVYCASHTLKGMLPEHPVILDVGANIGQFNFFGRNYLGAGRIVSIEPEAACFDLLARNAGNPADCVRCVVSDREGEVLFHVARSTQLSSYVADPEARYRESYAVPARTLDGIAAGLGLERIDLLKIDTEGSELDVLRSAERLLERTGVVLVEMSVFRESTGNLFRIGSFLEERGFVLAELSGAGGRHPRDIDAVFRRA